MVGQHIPGITHCDECGERLTANSACYDGWGTPRTFCTNPDCDDFWLDQDEF